MLSVGWSKRGRRLRLRHNEISREHFMETAQRLIYVKLPAEDRKVHREDKLGRFLRSMYGQFTEMGSWFLLIFCFWALGQTSYRHAQSQ